MDKRVVNILLCGVGGQGVVSLGNFIRHFLFERYGYFVTGTESRGVSQRGGSVTATVRAIVPSEDLEVYDGRKIGNPFRFQHDHKDITVLSPYIPPFSADIVIAAEPLELIGNFGYVNKRTIIIMNNQPRIPKNVITALISRSSSRADDTEEERNIKAAIRSLMYNLTEAARSGKTFRIPSDRIYYTPGVLFGLISELKKALFHVSESSEKHASGYTEPAKYPDTPPKFGDISGTENTGDLSQYIYGRSCECSKIRGPFTVAGDRLLEERGYGTRVLNFLLLGILSYLVPRPFTKEEITGFIYTFYGNTERAAGSDGAFRLGYGLGALFD